MRSLYRKIIILINFCEMDPEKELKVTLGLPWDQDLIILVELKATTGLSGTHL